MSQIIRLSRTCYHSCLIANHIKSKKCFINIPKSFIHTTQYAQKEKHFEDPSTIKEQTGDEREEILERIKRTALEEEKKRTTFKNDPDHIQRTTEVIDLKGPYKPPPLSAELDLLLKDNDPDTFGTLSKNVRTLVETNEFPDEADDVIETEIVDEKSGAVREHNLEYAKKIAKLVEENKIPEALNVLDVEMKRAGARPANYIYTLLIGACGRVGNTSKAFKLYTQMRKRGLKVTRATYTGLLNACATCRDSKTGLERVNFLRDKMREKQYDMNEANYNALIKVFGRHGKLSAAFTIVDEMLEKRIRPSLATFNFLLQACISDREAGFRHALLTWHKMRSRRVTPDLFSYNLLLRATRDCALGDEDATRLVIDALISPENQPILELDQKLKSSRLSFSPSSTSGQFSSTSYEPTESNPGMSFEETISESLPEGLIEGGSGANESSSMSMERVVENRPNLISRDPHLGSVISVGEVNTAQDRLLLLGGLSGVLSEMSADHLTPNIATFTLLLDCVPSALSAEQTLVSVMRRQRVKADTEFCNMLVKRRSFRGDYDRAKEVLTMFQEYCLEPDLITYGCLALTCDTQDKALKFIEEFNKSGFRLNKEILSAMLGQACHRFDVHYAETVLEMFIDYEVQPDKRVVKRTEDFVKKGLRIIGDKDKGLPLQGNLPGVVQASWFPGELFRFTRYHKKWLQRITVEEETPYETQFRVAQKKLATGTA
uniref:Pentatricopeptide repeat-containing protein 1, mitochondrial n=1 Tax=Cacopsylla melanoneura TaxID=428564 RepID=A0A8D8ZK45_9HEMI